jgi:rfaE bifunctional protein nucleotidyltransferase chain/domain
VADWQAAGQQVVFTNGCFDIVHLGHIDYLEKARALGDRLVVGLNTDASVSRLKGPLRPVVQEYARARLIAALAFVDTVILFDEPTPQALIEALRPDILTKGDDYTIETIVGAEFVLANGGAVKTIPLVQGYSTTQLIEKIKQSY